MKSQGSAKMDVMGKGSVCQKSNLCPCACEICKYLQKGKLRDVRVRKNETDSASTGYLECGRWKKDANVTCTNISILSRSKCPTDSKTHLAVAMVKEKNRKK